MSELNIPESWAEINWDDIIEIQGGSQPPKSTFSDKPKNGYIRLLQIRDFSSDKDAVYIPLEKANKTCEEDDVLIGRYGASIGRICTGKAGAYNVALAKVIYPKDSIIKPFLEYHLRAPEFQRFITNIGGRAAQAGFNKEDLSSLPFPLPPVLEQERIVQKIESCFSKIEETEQNLNKVEILLEKYRESLLAKAFRGELIPQNLDDEPASVLISKIREDRAQNQKGKKKEQEFSPISDEEKPFDIPESWEWVYSEEICSHIVDCPHSTPKFIDDGKMCLDTNSLKQGYIDYSKIRYVSDISFNERNIRLVPLEGDIVLSREGTLGNAVVLPKKDFCLGQRVMLFRPADGIDSFYFRHCIISPEISQLYIKKKKGMGVAHINMSDLRSFKFPLPPLKEQERIVKYLNTCLQNINTHHEALSRKKVLMKLMKEALLVKAFQGKLVHQVESEGTGHELLQKILEQKNQTVSAKESTKKKVAKKVSKKKTTKK